MKTARKFHHLLLLTGILISLFPFPQATSQSPSTTTPTPQAPTAVIRFFSEVNTNSVGLLLQSVDAQYKAGIRKFVILMSSSGGDVLSGFMAYNYLKGLPIEVTTFNVANVDSSASIIYCAGSKRYAVPEARFVIHEVSLTIPPTGSNTISIDLPTLDAQATILRSQEASMARILASAINKPESEAEAKIHAQKSLSSKEAQDWGLVQDIRTELFDPNNSILVMAAPSSGPTTNQNPSAGAPAIPAFSSLQISYSAK